MQPADFNQTVLNFGKTTKKSLLMVAIGLLSGRID
jgi:hypothetical protein